MPAVIVQQAFELALQHHRAGRLAEAEALYRQVLATDPEHAASTHLLGVVALQLGKNEAAIDFLRRAIAIRPSFPEAYSNLGTALRNQGRLADAIGAYRLAIHLQPEFGDACNNLGAALRENRELDEAIVFGQRAVALEPNNPDAHANLANALKETGRFDEAAGSYRRAITLAADHREARNNYALLLLLRGNFEPAWPLYEARRELNYSAQPRLSLPRWDGTLMNGKRVLIHAEQGFGDAIQFVRYAEPITERGGEVVVECSRQLVTLLRSAKGVSEVTESGDPLPRFDLHVPMLSLPLAFKTGLESIPSEVPYLLAEPARSGAWAKRLGTDRSRLRVGLAWAGNPKHPRNRVRNIPLVALAPILEVAGVEFYSLQLGAGSEQLGSSAGSWTVLDHTEHLRDFADTAALIMELDLVISVDTAVAHLAGALGKPVWTLLPFVPDWRWMLEREDSPWYPTMRLFRQPALGDWESVVHRVAEELELLAKGRKP